MPQTFKTIAFRFMCIGCLAAPAAAVSTSTYSSANCNFPDTGQNNCYDGTTQIGCPTSGNAFYGQDAQYASSATKPRYTVRNPVGISSVTVDNRTGLMWVTNPVDAGIGATYNWENAILACENNIGGAGTYAGYSDWRLPKVRELASIVDYGLSTVPPVNTTAFMNTVSDYYWTSTTHAVSPYPYLYAWSVNFGTMSGQVGSWTKATLYHVRCVRGGP